MKFKIVKEIKILTIGFLFILLGYASIQQYTTTFFSEHGLTNLGFEALILVYLSFTLSSLFSSIFISNLVLKIQ